MEPTIAGTVVGIQQIVYGGIFTVICTGIGAAVGGFLFDGNAHLGAGIGFIIGLLGTMFAVLMGLI